MTIHVALATDAAYLPWCATGVRSCLDRDAGDLHVHLFHDQPIAGADRGRLADMIRAAGAEVSWQAVEPERLAMLPSKGPALGSRTSWIRVLLPELLPGVDKVIYLDADTLVLQTLSDLWSTDLRGAPLGAVANVVEPARDGHIRELGLEPAGAYFNAGVLLMDLETMRRAGAVGRLTAFVAANRERLIWFDQDALNVTFAGSWHPLHPRWNAQNSFWTWGEWASRVFEAGPLTEAKSAPAIIHFEGPSICKPWHLLGDHPMRPRYLDVLARTPWAAQPLEGRTPTNRVIARLPAQRRLDAWVATERARLGLRAAARRIRVGARRIKAAAGLQPRPRG